MPGLFYASTPIVVVASRCSWARVTEIDVTDPAFDVTLLGKILYFSVVWCSVPQFFINKRFHSNSVKVAISVYLLRLSLSMLVIDNITKNF